MNCPACGKAGTDCWRWSDADVAWVCEDTGKITDDSMIRQAATAVEDLCKVRCPECKVEQIDYDGFGFLYCSACGLCLHPSRTNGVCLICGNLETVDV